MFKGDLGLAALLFVAPAANAVTFVGGYDIAVNNPGNPGLEIVTESLADPFAFSLDEGESITFDLFRIWTRETSVNAFPPNNDDVLPRPISVNFSFTQPTGPGGAVTGSTNGVNLVVVQFGTLEWANDGIQSFAFGNGTVLEVDLSNATFNGGLFGLRPGKNFGANVSATFTVTAIPEPATWAMMIGGFGLAGAAVRRRRAATQVLA